MNKMSYEELKYYQSLSLEEKIKKSKSLISAFLEENDNNCYVSFSGGKDSTVMLDLVRSINKDIEAVYINTGLEFPEIIKFVKETKNVTIIKPKILFKDFIEKEGFPIVSKEISQKIYEVRNTKSPYLLNIRMNGYPKTGAGKLSLKWRYLIDADIKITNKCCNTFKKLPVKKFERKTKKKGFIGTMASESTLRLTSVLKTCFNQETKSTPIAFWKEVDIWNYIKIKNLNYSKIYDMGYNRTGCVGCPYGAHLEKGEGRYITLKRTHPALYNYVINKMNFRKMLDLIGVKYE